MTHEIGHRVILLSRTKCLYKIGHFLQVCVLAWKDNEQEKSKKENLLKMKAEGLKQNCNSNNILLAPGSPCLCYNPLNVLFLL